MQIKRLTEYAIRFLLYLACQEGNTLVPGGEIARQMGIGAGYIRRVTHALCRVKLVESEPGFQGGFYLSRPAEEITLYDIMMAAEDTMALNRCLLDKGLCDRGAAPYCKVHQCFIVFQGEMEARLQDIHLSDLV